MASYQLRPMSVGEILDGAFTLVRRQVGVFLGQAIVCLVLPTALLVFMAFAGPDADPLLFVVWLVLVLIGYTILTGAAVRVVSEVFLGRPAGLGDGLRFASAKFWRILVASFGAGIVVTLAEIPGAVAGNLVHPALMVLMFPAVVVFLGYSLVVQVAVLEPLNGATDALGRSWALTRGHKGRALALWAAPSVLMIMVYLGFLLVIGILSSLVPLLLIPLVVIFALILLLWFPLVSCVFTLFYYDLRVRKEAFDLELLSQQIGLSPSHA